MTRGAVILCGGRSSRMGRDKALLSVGSGEVMLERVARRVSEVVAADRIVCVGGPGQQLPELPAGIRILRDPEPHCGPLVGLAVGLRELQSEAEAIFLCACDVPLLVPAFVARMFELLGAREAAAVHDGARWHPLGAVYRTSILTQVESRLRGDDQSLAGLLQAMRVRRVTVEEVRDIDPQFRSLASCNTEEEYRAIMGDG